MTIIYRKPDYIQKIKRPEITDGRIKNHPHYKEGECAEMKTFRNGNTNRVLALIDVALEEKYLVPPSKREDKEVHELYQAVCEHRKIPYLDRGGDFPIAVPFSFYLAMCEEFNLSDRYEECIKLENVIQSKWEAWKADNR